MIRRDIDIVFFGTTDTEMWSLDPATRGRQTPAFEVWAEELQPWIDRFVN
jgi:hypothetical protein